MSLSKINDLNNSSRSKSTSDLSSFVNKSDNKFDSAPLNSSNEKPHVKVPKSRHTINEMVNTERDYVNDLAIVLDRYRDLMRKNDKNKVKMPKSLEDGKNNFVFGNISEIYEWHKSVLYPKLIEAAEFETNCLNKICQLFISYEDQFTKLYAKFCKNKPKSEFIIIEFQPYFDWLRSHLNEKFNLSDYLIKPVQRITKYSLLLNSLKENVLKEGINTNANFDKSIQVMSRIPEKANDMMKVGRLENYDGDVPDELLFLDTVFVYEFKGNLKDPKMISKISKIVNFERRQIFLFQHKIIFSDIIESDMKFVSPRYIFKNEIKTNQLEFQIHNQVERKFILTITNRPKHMLCVSEKNYKKLTKMLEDIIKNQNSFIQSLITPPTPNRRPSTKES